MQHHEPPDNPPPTPEDTLATPAGQRSFRQQLGSNWLALLSILIAVFGVSYNTYRNETTEHQRNVRQAAFVVLDALADLQQLADSRFFGGDRSEANRIAIWGHVVVIRDLTILVSEPAGAKARLLFSVWSEGAEAFDAGDTDAERRLAGAVAELRSQVVADLARLR